MTDVIAVDGPAASGKSTVSKRVASGLGWLYVDSGALYRAVTWKALELGTDTNDAACLAALAEGLNIEFLVTDGAVTFRVDGVAPGQALRSQAVNEHVSPVAAVPAVRRCVVAWLRSMRALGSLVVEGRDIGTVVFPDARYKFYLDADPAERARRRHAELADAMDTGQPSVGDVHASLARRDARDSGRKTAPLRIADDAVVIDSTAMGIAEVAACIVEAARGGGGLR